MIRHSLLYTLLAAFAAAFCACSSSTDSESVALSLDDAFAAIDEGDYARAVELCNRLTETSDSVLLTWHDYCRAAAVYAVAYDNDVNMPASMASATRCLDRAREMQPDSVRTYVDMLSHEYSGALNTAIQTLDGLMTDRSTIGDHEEGDFVDYDKEHDLEEPHNSEGHV